MSDFEIRPMTVDDAIWLAKNLRDIDRLEAETMMPNHTVEGALLHMLANSRKAVVGAYRGKVFAAWGCLFPAALSTFGAPWLVGTKAVSSKIVRKFFLRNSREQIADVSKGATHLFNFVHSDNLIAIRWLKWCGFKFEGEPVTVGKHNFLKFEMERSDVL